MEIQVSIKHYKKTQPKLIEPTGLYSLGQVGDLILL